MSRTRIPHSSDPDIADGKLIDMSTHKTDMPTHKRKIRPYKTWLYNLLLALVSPVLLLWLGWRMLVQRKSSDGLSERFGVLPQELVKRCQTDDPVVWFHAASVGEVAAAEPIIAAFRRHEPLAQIILSTITPTGRARAQKIEGHIDGLMYFPFDLPFAVHRVFSLLQPQLFVMVETELWPNTLAEAAHRGTRVAMVNARLSGRSWTHGRLLRGLYRWMLGNVSVICAQSEADAERFVHLGAPAERLQIAGNSKFDQNFPVADAAQADKWRHSFGFALTDRVLLAGSTHPGEEEPLLHLFQQLRTEFDDVQLIIAPRHPERADAVEALIRQCGYEVTRRTHVLAGEVEPVGTGGQSAVAHVGLLDTIGELASLFSAADVVFMGGSLVSIGGHDLLQPLAAGKPVIVGPFMHKTRDIMDLALREKVVFQVRDLDELHVMAVELLAEADERERLAVEGPAMIARYRGASEACARALEELLNDSPTGEQ